MSIACTFCLVFKKSFRKRKRKKKFLNDFCFLLCFFSKRKVSTQSSRTKNSHVFNQKIKGFHKPIALPCMLHVHLSYMLLIFCSCILFHMYHFSHPSYVPMHFMRRFVFCRLYTNLKSRVNACYICLHASCILSLLANSLSEGKSLIIMRTHSINLYITYDNWLSFLLRLVVYISCILSMHPCALCIISLSNQFHFFLCTIYHAIPLI